MFIDILIVSISATVQLESLITPICQLQRFSDLIAICKLQTPDKYYRQKSSAIINQRQNTQFL